MSVCPCYFGVDVANLLACEKGGRGGRTQRREGGGQSCSVECPNRRGVSDEDDFGGLQLRVLLVWGVSEEDDFGGLQLRVSLVFVGGFWFLLVFVGFAWLVFVGFGFCFFLFCVRSVCAACVVLRRARPPP